MSKQDEAGLILKLYDLRREAVMREARNWYVRDFHPQSMQDVIDVLLTDKNTYYRMVVSYWDMACSFVVNGAIDAEMFNAANGEHYVVYAKIEPFIEELRAFFKNPNGSKHLEQVVMGAPDAKERMAHIREMMKQWAARSAQADGEQTATAKG